MGDGAGPAGGRTLRQALPASRDDRS